MNGYILSSIIISAEQEKMTVSIDYVEVNIEARWLIVVSYIVHIHCTCIHESSVDDLVIEERVRCNSMYVYVHSSTTYIVTEIVFPYLYGTNSGYLCSYHRMIWIIHFRCMISMSVIAYRKHHDQLYISSHDVCNDWRAARQLFCIIRFDCTWSFGTWCFRFKTRSFYQIKIGDTIVRLYGHS